MYFFFNYRPTAESGLKYNDCWLLKCQHNNGNSLVLRLIGPQVPKLESHTDGFIIMKPLHICETMMGRFRNYYSQINIILFTDTTFIIIIYTW